MLNLHLIPVAYYLLGFVTVCPMAHVYATIMAYIYSHNHVYYLLAFVILFPRAHVYATIMAYVCANESGYYLLAFVTVCPSHTFMPMIVMDFHASHISQIS